MSIRTIFETCRPRTDVLHGTVAEADFAADLAQVVTGGGSAEYVDPVRFFANTYPTRGLKNLLANVCRRLSGAGGEQPVERAEQYAAWLPAALAVLDDEVRDGEHRPFSICVSGAQRQQEPDGVQDGGVAVHGTRRGRGDRKHGRAVERAFGVLVDERQFVAGPVAQTVQDGGDAGAGTVGGLVAGGVIPEDDRWSAGRGPARPGHGSAVSAEVGDGAARPAGRREEIEEESPAILVLQYKSGEVLAGGVAQGPVAVRRGRFGQQRGNVGVVEVRVQPQTVACESVETNQRVAVVVEGGRPEPRPPRGERDPAVQDQGVDVAERSERGSALAQLKERRYADKYRAPDRAVHLFGVEISGEFRDVVVLETERA